jgi:hypothetical protein
MPIIRTSLCLTVVLSGTGVGYASLDSDIAIKDIGHNQYELTLHTTTTINVFEAQRELAQPPRGPAPTKKPTSATTRLQSTSHRLVTQAKQRI